MTKAPIEKTTTSSGSPTNDLLLSAASVVGVAIAGVALWQFSVGWFGLPKILLPTPSEVFRAGWDRRVELLSAGSVTLYTAAVSLLVAIFVGTLTSILFSQSRLIRRAFFPYVVFLQTVPIVAIAPLLIIWSGYEFRTAVIATVIICLFPIVNNVTTGLTSASSEHHELFQLYSASRWQTLWRLQIPNAIPFLMLGARISSGLAVIGAIVAEFFVSNGADYIGLGVLMTAWQGQLKTDALIAALGVSAVLGLILFGSVQFVAKVFLHRYTRVN